MTALPNSGKEGAASAAPSPTTPEDAERLLAAATSPEQAWAIYEISSNREEGWRVVRLKAERRYGELLGPPDRTKPKSDRLSDSAYQGQSRARKVAAVPQPAFDAYIKKEGAKATREGLFRAQKPPKQDTTLKGKAGLSHDPEVIEWVRAKYKKGWNRDRLVAASEAGTDGWPRPDGALTNGGVSECRAVIAALERMEGEGEVNHHPSGATARLKMISVARKKDPGKLWDLRYQLMKIVGWLAQLDLLEWGIEEWERGGINDLYDDLTLLDEWNTRALARASAYIDDDGIRERIRKMKENQTGRTDAEKQNIKRRVAALERRLENKLSR